MTGYPSLPQFLLSLADNALILGHRNSEWCGHGPVLEQDIAITNISLDLIGQARYFFQYAASLIGNGATEDTLAYLRDSRQFYNCLMPELPKGDWAFTTLRQFFFSQFQFLQYSHLKTSQDEQISAICEKAIKETAYHLRWSREWVIRLGDGTTESHKRMLAALEQLWPYTGEMFLASAYETELAEKFIAVNPGNLKADWAHAVNLVFEEATLPVPNESWMHEGGKTGKHTEHLGYILAEMQFLQRAYPGCEW